LPKYHINISNNQITDWYVDKIIQIDQTRNIYINELTKCTICYESDINIQTNCSHSYCLNCIREWNNISSECPLCKQKITHMYNLINKN